ncbi:hypothetical protein RIR_jg2123.t1 [Rhizophagus irregularis DAOM 181602=DAOM 197198]|nr:hypothetical protein RIR_jg2123.t1 [Rhizophagus irregularis DAOM 181602=DAOM 197198]
MICISWFCWNNKSKFSSSRVTGSCLGGFRNNFSLITRSSFEYCSSTNCPLHSRHLHSTNLFDMDRLEVDNRRIFNSSIEKYHEDIG